MNLIIKKKVVPLRDTWIETIIKKKRNISSNELTEKGKLSLLYKSKQTKEESPYLAIRQFIEREQDRISDLFLKLFLQIRKKWLRLDSEFTEELKKAIDDDPFKLNGKIYISAKTGKPLTNKEWQLMLRSLDKYFVAIFKNTPEMLVKKAMALGKILERMDYQNRINTPLEDIKFKPIEGNEDWKNIKLYGEQNSAEYIVWLSTNSRKRIATTINSAIKNGDGPQNLASKLFDEFGSMNRDWRRIAMTEISYNVTNGILLTELEQAEPGETIFMQGISGPEACPFCKNNINGKIFVLQTKPTDKKEIVIDGVKYPIIFPGLTNVDVKKANWRPTIAAHPHCLCVYIRYYPEMKKSVNHKYIIRKGYKGNYKYIYKNNKPIYTFIKHDPAKMKIDEFIDYKEYTQKLRKLYIKNGEKIASSRLVPQEQYKYETGSWRIDKESPDKYGKQIDELREINVNDLIPSEETEGQKKEDVERYAKWDKEGKQAPPIEVIETDKGQLKIINGHRRWYAAKKAGKKTILAWVNPKVKSGLIDSKGKPMYTGLTYELTKGENLNKSTHRLILKKSLGQTAPQGSGVGQGTKSNEDNYKEVGKNAYRKVKGKWLKIKKSKINKNRMTNKTIKDSTMRGRY